MSAKRIHLSLFIVLISLLASSLLTGAGRALAGTETLLRTDPARLEIAVGEEKTLAVVIENAQEIYAIDISGTFNQDMVEVLDANISRSGVQLVPGTIPQPDFVVVNSADNDLGTFRYAVTQINPSEPMSGSGTVFSITLRGQSEGLAAMAFTTVTLADQDGKPLPLNFINGAIQVLAEPVRQYLFLPLVRR